MHANILNANFYICLLSAQISLNLAISVASLIKKINKVFVKWEFFSELDVGKWQDDGWIAFCATGFPALLCVEQLIKGWKGKSKRGQGESRNRFWVSIMVRVCLTFKVRQPSEFNLKADGGVAHIWHIWHLNITQGWMHKEHSGANEYLTRKWGCRSTEAGQTGSGRRGSL